MDSINKIHLELTTKCNATCWRYLDDNSKVCLHGRAKPKDLSYSILIKFLNNNSLKKIKEIKLCGGLGEPTLHPKFLEVVDHFKKNNIKIELSTNGDTHTRYWWKELGKLLNEKDKVYFGIDGLGDTLGKYRGTSFKRIIDNIKEIRNETNAYIEWQFIIFKHNEHQVIEAKNISKNLKINFQIIESGEYNSFLEKPVYTICEPSNKKETHNLKNKYVFVGADGYASPGHFNRFLSSDIYFGKIIMDSPEIYLKMLKLKDKLSIMNNTLEEISITLYENFRN